MEEKIESLQSQVNSFEQRVTKLEIEMEAHPNMLSAAHRSPKTPLSQHTTLSSN